MFRASERPIKREHQGLGVEVVRIGFLLSWIFLSNIQGSESFEYFPGADYDPSVPTLKEVVGYDFGERLSTHNQVESYLKTLAESSPRVQLIKTGESWEGRSLYYLIVSSEGNLARVDEVKAGMQKLADPRKLDGTQADELIEVLPAVTWLSYGIHGNETSSGEAALLTAYHLAATLDDPMVESILENTVVIIDPAQNPDGRDRFVNHFRQARGPIPNPDQDAAEHNEPWPSGRVNHYLFDMNRDWFACTQIESRVRVRSFLEWFPVVFVDLHEMGSDSTYYFPPTPAPASPHVTPNQVKWTSTFGENNARWFDRFGFDYFTREVFDAFYPGYGTSWPMMHGSVGMTYEQASVRGLAVRKSDETLMLFRDAIQHHFISSLSTAETTARNRFEVLRDFYEFRLSAVEEGQQDEVKEYILPPGRDPGRVKKLAALLISQGVEVMQAEADFKNEAASEFGEDNFEPRGFPEGTLVIPLAQPGRRLIRTLLDRNVPMGEEFLEEQVRRVQERKPDQIYDVTSWSLPLLYGLRIFGARASSEGSFAALEEPLESTGEVVGRKAGLAYLIPWGQNSSALVLSQLLAKKIRVFFTDKSLTMGGIEYPAGSLIIKVKNNPSNLHELLQEISETLGVKVYGTSTGWVEDGVNLGSQHVHFLKPPSVALAWSEPTHQYSAGWTRYVLEQMYQIRVTAIHTDRLLTADLKKFNVLILPNARGRGYEGVLGASGAAKLEQWIAQGGTLVTFASATTWLTGEDVKLLATQRELRGGSPERPLDESKKEEKSGSSSVEPDREFPASTSGAILRVELDRDHWLAAGYDGHVDTIFEGRTIFTPLKLNKGRNVGLFSEESKVVRSGFVLEEVRQQVAGKAYLMYQSHERGHVVAFAQDPNYRAYFDGLNLLFLNPIFFGPSM